MAGGGVALLRAKAVLTALTGANADVTAGISIVMRALEAPIRQIAENSGVEGSIVVGKLTDGKDANQGFDAQNERYVDMIKAGIVDPAKVVRTALQDAGSIAALLITAEAMIAEIPQKDAPATGASFCGISAIIASAVIRSAAIEPASWRAVRTTLAGSTMPALIMST